MPGELRGCSAGRLSFVIHLMSLSAFLSFLILFTKMILALRLIHDPVENLHHPRLHCVIVDILHKLKILIAREHKLELMKIELAREILLELSRKVVDDLRERVVH